MEKLLESSKEVNKELIQTPPLIKNVLEKQQYRFVGEYNHTAVKICGWTKNMLRSEGGCYKLKFYGIMSHQCMQMSPSISCANRCTFCWRDYKAPVSKEWVWGIDEPEVIIDGSLHEHHKLLNGFKGNPKTNQSAYRQSKTVKHVALSLTGEPISYPKINELIDQFHSQGISTFLVTNATYPEQIKNLHPITQLYISLDAPTKELLKEVDKPLFDDFWERLNQSLEYMSEKEYRTCIRLTMIKGINMIQPEEYAKLIKKGNPDFIEVKAYMYVGASTERLKRENMPLHEEVIEFTKELVNYLPDYEICSEHISSRVVMVAKKEYKIDGIWTTWIDFPKFHELIEQGNPVKVKDFLKKTPASGLSGSGTLDRMKKKDDDTVFIDLIDELEVKIDEKTPELNFWTEKNPDNC